MSVWKRRLSYTLGALGIALLITVTALTFVVIVAGLISLALGT